MAALDEETMLNLVAAYLGGGEDLYRDELRRAVEEAVAPLAHVPPFEVGVELGRCLARTITAAVALGAGVVDALGEFGYTRQDALAHVGRIVEQSLPTTPPSDDHTT